MTPFGPSDRADSSGSKAIDAPEDPASSALRIPVLDAIRFFAALVVMMTHVGVPSFPWFAVPGLPVGFSQIVRDLFDGAAAVTVFFIISGFCIHFPVHRDGGRLRLLPYFARRGLRILPPFLMAYALSRVFVGEATSLTRGVFWTLACELLYYFIYPAMLALRRRLASWVPLLITAFLGAAGVALGLSRWRPEQMEVFQSNVLLSAVHGLPCWLLGCVLAERWRNEPASEPTGGRVVTLRGGMLAAVVAMLALRLRFHVGHVWTLLPFALFAALWLEVEVRHARRSVLCRFERLGRWSYSLYVVHMPAFVIVSDGLPWRQILGRSVFTGWAIQMIGVLLLAWLFHGLMEAPSHVLARRVARRLEAGREKADGVAPTPEAR